MSGVSSSVWGLFHTQPRGGTGAPFRLDATVLLENMVLPRPVSNEVSFPVLRSVVFCSSLDHFQQNCWNHFCYTVVVVLQVLGMFVYSSYFKLAHIGSLDHYVSFLLAPTTAKGPFWLCLYLDISPRTWVPRVYFTQSIYLYTAGLLFCIGLKRPFRPCFLWRGLLLFFKGSGGPVLRTSTFSETSFVWALMAEGVLCFKIFLAVSLGFLSLRLWVEFFLF